MPHLWEHVLLGDPETGVIKAADRLGAMLDGFVDVETMGFVLLAPPERLRDAAQALEEGLGFPETEPSFYRDEVEAVIRELEVVTASPSLRLGRAMRRMLGHDTGPDLHPACVAGHLREMTYADVRQAFLSSYDPHRLVVAAVAPGEEAGEACRTVRLGGLPYLPDASGPALGSAAGKDASGPAAPRAFPGDGPPAGGAVAGAAVFRLGPAAARETTTLVRVLDALLIRAPRAPARLAARRVLGRRARVASAVVEHSRQSFYALEWYARPPVSPVDLPRATARTRALVETFCAGLDRVAPEDVAGATRWVAKESQGMSA